MKKSPILILTVFHLLGKEVYAKPPSKKKLAKDITDLWEVFEEFEKQINSTEEKLSNHQEIISSMQELILSNQEQITSNHESINLALKQIHADHQRFVEMEQNVSQNTQDIDCLKNGNCAEDASNSIIIINGYDGRTHDLPTNLLNLETGKNTSCVSLSSFNIQNNGGAGGTLDKIPVICGGWNGTDPIKSCYKLGDPNPFYEMTVPRAYPAFVVKDQKLLVLGGGSDTQVASSSELVSIENGQSEMGPEMPFTLLFGCATWLSSSEIIVIGGKQNQQTTNKTHIYNFDTTTWTQGPSLKNGINAMACASFDGIVITTGGVPFTDLVEVLLPSDYSSWQKAASLPGTKFGHVTLPNNKKTGFLTLGGSEDNVLSNSIYELLCDVNGCGNQWNLIGFFNGPRGLFMAFYVPDSTELTGSAASKQRNHSNKNVTMSFGPGIEFEMFQ